MKEPEWLLPEIVTAVQQMLIAEHGGSSGIRDNVLLDSAVNRPRQRFSYAAGASTFDLAASYCYGVAKNHPFVDGNKRVSLTIAALCIEVNGYLFDAPEAGAVVMIESLAAGNATEAELSKWLREWSVPKGG